MKLLLLLVLALTGIALTYHAIPTFGSGASSSITVSAACGCGDLADLKARLRAVNSVLQMLNSRANGSGMGDPLTTLSEQDLRSAITGALASANAGRVGTILANINRSSCAITPSQGISSCMRSAADANLENQRDACDNWSTSSPRNGNSFRVGYTLGETLAEEVVSYSNEQSFIQDEILRLAAENCGRGATRNPPTQSPQNPTTTQPPQSPPIGQTSHNPPGKMPPPTNPPAPGTGYVEYILDGTMTFPALGVFKMQADSTIPFKIVNGVVTGQGTIVTEFIPPSNCSVEGYDPADDGTTEIKVNGRVTGNVMDVTFGPTHQTLGSNQGVTAAMKLTCEVGGAKGFAMNYPKPQRPFIGHQRLTLPSPGQPFAVTNVAPPQANFSTPEFGNIFSTKVTLKVFYRR